MAGPELVAGSDNAEMRASDDDWELVYEHDTRTGHVIDQVRVR